MVLCKSLYLTKIKHLFLKKIKDTLVMNSLKLSLNKRKLFFCYLGFALCQIFANLKKKKKKA